MRWGDEVVIKVKGGSTTTIYTSRTGRLDIWDYLRSRYGAIEAFPHYTKAIYVVKLAPKLAGFSFQDRLAYIEIPTMRRFCSGDETHNAIVIF